MMTAQIRVMPWVLTNNRKPPSLRPFERDFQIILQLALKIDSDEQRVRQWYISEKIEEFGDKTAQELVVMGETDYVINFLMSIRSGLRD